MNKLGNYFSDKYLMTSDSIPTEGSFEVGDIVINTGENISEEPFWICTESGTPGVWQSINVKSTTKMVSFKNKVILTEATDTVNIGIDSFNIERDTLIVFINDAYAYEHVDYVIDGTNIKTLDNKIWNEGLIEDFVFEFIVFKSILCIDESGILLLDQIPNGILTVNKFSQDIQEKLNFATTDLSVYQKHTEQNLPTNNKTIVGAINELFQNVDSGKGLIAAAIDDESITKDSTFQAMSNTIETLRKSSENELSGVTNLKIVLSDEGVNTTEDDNLASLITKVDNQFNSIREQLIQLMIDGGYNVTNENINSLLEILSINGIGPSEIKQVAAGSEYTFVLKTDGNLYGTGYSYSGELGVAAETDYGTFRKINVTDVDKVFASTFNSFIIKKDGSLWGCGANSYGELGLGTQKSIGQFTKIPDMDNVKDVSCGYYHSFAIKNDGTVWACGYNNRYQLGLGDTTNRTAFTQVTSMTNAKQIVCGGYDYAQYSIAIKSDGTVWGCGYNAGGQLGINSTTDASNWTQSNMTDAVKVMCGDTHTLAIKSDGSVWACGANTYGALGLTYSYTRSLQFLQTNISDVIEIACGQNHSLALKTDGTVWGCGYPGNGCLNRESDNYIYSFATLSMDNIKHIACGSSSTFMLSNDDQLFACGLDYGRLGLGEEGEVFYATELPRGL